MPCRAGVYLPPWGVRIRRHLWALVFVPWCVAVALYGIFALSRRETSPRPTVVKEAFPNNEIVMQPLSLSVACHIGPGSLAIAGSKKVV